VDASVDSDSGGAAGGGTGGSGGVGGGTGGTAGVSGSAGAVADAGDASAGSAGTAGAGGTAGSGGSAGGAPDAGPDAPVTCVAQVRGGGRYACARRTDGTAWCWGSNENGQLGLGSTGASNPLPQQVTDLGNTVIELAVGYNHACALKADHTVWCWGANNLGQLGDGTIGGLACAIGTCLPKPQQVSALGSTVARIKTGAFHTCAHLQDGSMWCWGQNNEGQVGDGTIGDACGSDKCKSTPVKVAALGNAVAEIAPAGAMTCARKTDNTVWCWGVNNAGQLGRGTAGNSQPVPGQVTALGTATARLFAGDGFTCAQKSDATFWCWGWDGYGQVGDADTYYSKPAPLQVASLGTDVTHAAACGYHTCVRKKDKSIWCWGGNHYGQTGDGTANGGACYNAGSCRSVPVLANTVGNNVTELFAGHHFIFALREDGTLWAWGSNEMGQIGDGTIGGQTCNGSPNCKLLPVQVKLPCP
jgi:alpha-tubulin suppressor-like RCC1 family protein